MQLDFDQFTEYVTEGPVVHSVPLDVHALDSDLALQAVAGGYQHAAALGRLPTLDTTALDSVRTAAAGYYQADVIAHEIASDDPAIITSRLLFVRARPEWRVGIDVAPDDAYGGVYLHAGTLWRCVLAHTTQVDWQPGAAGTDALWTRYYQPGEVPVWVQPLAAFDAWHAGQHVMHAGQEWVSERDYNVWEPGTPDSGWVLVDTGADEWPAWVQPTGAHDAYPEDAQVTHNGQRWISDVPNNVWEPGVYGWQLQA